MTFTSCCSEILIFFIIFYYKYTVIFVWYSIYFVYLCCMKEKLKNYKLVGVKLGDQDKSVNIGKLKQKVYHDSYWSMGKIILLGKKRK